MKQNVHLQEEVKSWIRCNLTVERHLDNLLCNPQKQVTGRELWLSPCSSPIADVFQDVQVGGREGGGRQFSSISDEFRQLHLKTCQLKLSRFGFYRRSRWSKLGLTMRHFHYRVRQKDKTGSRSNQIELRGSLVKDNWGEQLHTDNGDTEICISQPHYLIM